MLEQIGKTLLGTKAMFYTCHCRALNPTAL